MLYLGHQDALGLLARHVGDPLELLFLLAVAFLELRFDVVERLLLVAQLPLAAVEVLPLAVEVLLFLKKSLFDLLRLCPVLAGFLFGGGADFDGFLFGFEQLFLGLRLCLE